MDAQALPQPDVAFFLLFVFAAAAAAALSSVAVFCARLLICIASEVALVAPRGPGPFWGPTICIWAPRGHKSHHRQNHSDGQRSLGTAP